MTKRVFAVVILAFSLLFLFTHFSYALYSWVDEKGVTHFTDYPKPTKEREEEPRDEKQENVSPSGQTGASVPARQDQEIKRPIVAPIVKQPEVQQKTVPSAQAPVGTQVRKPGEAAPQMPAQPTGKGTLTIPVPIAQPQPVVTPPTGQGSARPEMRAPLSQREKDAALAAVVLAKYLPTLLIVVAVFYFYYCLCSYLIAKKLDVPAAWLAWIPILQIWTFIRSSGKPFWWVLLLFIPFLNIIIIAYLWICIVENLGKNKWLGLLMLVPIINMVYLGVLAFSSKEA
jgi:hypothetical protein